jgi:hypothetical protein
MFATPSHHPTRLHHGLVSAFAHALGLACSPASATTFSTFQQFESSHDSLLAGDGYPGRMKLLNHRNKDVCVYFRFMDSANQVLRMSRVGARLPASRQDLGVRGPGENSRRLEIGVLTIGEPIFVNPSLMTFHHCAPFEQVGFLGRTTVLAGEVKRGQGFEVDARSWNGNSRDITVHIR